MNAAASFRLNSLRAFWPKLPLANSARHDCIHAQSVWRRLRGRSACVLFQASRYCIGECLERALLRALLPLRAASRPLTVSHRVPLGLLLLSRHQLTPERLRAALQAQQDAGTGKIGEWLVALGFASEQQVTAALAHQWACPVLRSADLLVPAPSPQIPLALLESSLMFAVDYVEPTRTLHLAFGDHPDYTVLYAVERMIECRTVTCMAPARIVRAWLQAIPTSRSGRELVFACGTSVPEFARTLCSYCAHLSISEIRLIGAGTFIWARLLRVSHPPLDLLLRLA